MLKPLFDVQRIHVDGSRLYYEVYYKTGKSFTKIVDACFLTSRAASEYINQLISEV
jgi:hypothetical protein